MLSRAREVVTKIYIIMILLFMIYGVSAKEKIDLIIDTDPGSDDIVALLLALSSEKINVRAITTVAGNVSVKKTSRNAGLAREWAGHEEVPIYVGASFPLQRSPTYASHIHGEEGITGVPIYSPKKGPEKKSAVRYLVETLNTVSPKSVTLAMLGPQTNLALALIEDPGIKRGIKEVVVMGGSHFSRGNVTPAAEFNIFADPHAADIVLKSGLKITYIPLDLTHKILTTKKRLQKIESIDNKPAKLASNILRGYIIKDMQEYSLKGGPIHDANVIGFLIEPRMFYGRYTNLVVDTRKGPTMGETIVDWYNILGNKKNVFWVSEGNSEKFFTLLEKSFSSFKS